MPDWTQHVRPRLAGLRLSPTREAEIVEELSQHLDDRWRELIASGMSPEQATRVALADFRDGNLLADYIAPLRQAHPPSAITPGVPGTKSLSDFWQDIRYGARMLLKNPGVTVIVIMALALGIGANTAIFSVVNTVLIRPLPYDESERLIFLTEKDAVRDEMSISYPNFTDWRNQNQTFEKMGVYNRADYNLTGAGDAERIGTGQVSADLFSVLRVNAAHGRVFTNEEDRPGGAPVVVLSHGLWQRRFGGQTSIIGHAITLNGKSYTVIGVMPESYLYPSGVEMWVPVGQLSDRPNWQQRGNHPGLTGVARLKPGVTFEQAEADMNNVAVNLEKQYPDTNRGNRIRLRPLLETFVVDVRRTLWVVLGVVAAVLLIACANIANLLLARATARRKEMAIRTAVGASRWRIARQLLTESILISLIGGSIGLILGYWGVQLILYISPTAIPRSREISLDWTVLGFTIGVSFLTGTLFGLIPAIQAAHVDVHETLKKTGRTTSGRHWLRSSLVVGEVATTLVVLIFAGLMIRSFYKLHQVNPGFSDERLTSFRVSLPEKKYETEEARGSFYNRLLEDIRTLPGVESAAAASGLPLGNNSSQIPFVIDGQSVPPRDQMPKMEACIVTPDYFKAMNIPVVRGRVFTDRDNRSHLAGRDLSKLNGPQRLLAGLNLIVIDEEFARRHWPNEDAVGKRIKLIGFPDNPTLEVIGVVGRVKMESLNQNSDRVQGYFAFNQVPDDSMIVTIKGASDPNQLINSVRAVVKRIDPDQPIYNARTMNEIRAESVQSQRVTVTLLSLFAGIALVLAIVGIYGVMSYSVTQRTHEIGIRMAVGARPRDVFKMILGHGMKLALIGVGLGLLLALAVTRFMVTMLFGVEPTDAATFGAIPLILSTVALLACYLPGRRATKVEPTISLRYE
jgi:putative ABC transport system permease protein